ncbi:MAG: hypothetical protein C0417_04050 [Chlorobiaceae bacterium]|nr:hypothetical protein [Chlorobiaceae bacterium]
MDANLIALKLFLDELNVQSDIDTLDKRKTVQKAVYLGQLSGVNLGYTFSWYLMGPYSIPLSKDYYALEDSLSSKHNGSYKSKELIPPIKKKLARIKPLLNMPTNVALSNQVDWLELVSSVHFLHYVSQLSWAEVTSVIKREKKHVAPYIEEAKAELRKLNLI